MNKEISLGKRFFDFLKERLTKPLPGIISHSKLLPKNDIDRTIIPNNIKIKSAVLILFDSDLNIVLTKRPHQIKTHPNQISFPGGRCEAGETMIQTALREAEEEIGLSSEFVEVIPYPLTNLFIPPSQSFISPIIAFSESIPPLTPSPDEVAKIIFLSIEKLLHRNYTTHNFQFNGNSFAFPAWDIGEKVLLWGATAMVLSELIDLFAEFTLDR